MSESMEGVETHEEEEAVQEPEIQSTPENPEDADEETEGFVVPAPMDDDEDDDDDDEEDEEVPVEVPSAPLPPGEDPLLLESSAYDVFDLARPLQRCEIARDHVVFGSMCSLDAGKRHILHLLEPPVESVHGGVVLVAAGNTIQILKLGTSLGTNNIVDRKYLFGTSGSGIGSLAVHPSRRFFAVAEKGVKPNICIYQYPSARVCRILRNGTELAYSSVTFSQDGETLASVGCAPDFLLTVWNWRQEQTILRSKAFGQDVFSVRFAPQDSGFLTTSGVGHIRFWKMASTFTGLKLQGDIGKFGKSELSDIEAFCVLPDKKVLSGTERGVLLLWDGNFIKCELLTSRRHLPHNGRIHVVQYDAESSLIVTAGSDGFVKFWSFEAIDRADLPPDDTVALVPMKRQILIHPKMDIRAVVKLSTARYLVQDACGSIHLLALDENDDTAFEVLTDYVPNATGRTTGVVASPYEHLAASCGIDGTIHAWDYTTDRCLFSATTTVFSKDSDGSPRASSAAATAISWVPNASAFVTTENQLVPKSRQVIVGFSDGVVRVFLMDLIKRAWVRTNVFKPHRARVSTLAFSPSGVYFVSASDDDATFFLFKVVPSGKTSKFTKFPPDYLPLGFQRVGESGVRAVSWREDDEALLVTLTNGRVIEYSIPMDGTLEALAELKQRHAAATEMETESREDDDQAKENETYELKLTSREFPALTRRRPMATPELDALEALNPNGNPQVEDKIRSDFHVETRVAPVMAWTAQYQTKDTFFLSLQGGNALPSASNALLLCQWGSLTPLLEYATEDTTPLTTLVTSSSRKYMLCGLGNGKFQLRSLPRPYAFLTGEFHDVASDSNVLSTRVVMSFDDSYVLTAGGDGNLSICRVHSEQLELAARLLMEKYETLQVEGKIAGEQAQQKQQAQCDMLQKAALDAKNSEDGGGSTLTAPGNELTMLPKYQRARAYAAYIETHVDEVAKDEESFRGVVRLLTDTNSTLGMSLAGMPRVEEGQSTALLALLETLDLANPSEAYTIEDAKRQSEVDAKARATQSKQDRTRDVLFKMRAQLLELQAQDASYPPESRLDDDEWEIDLDYGEILAQQGEQACEEVRRELAFAVEKEELLLMKMRETYVNQLAVELITLRAFESGLCVQSFRTMKMPPVLQKRLNEIYTSEAGVSKGETSASSTISRRPSVLQIMTKDSALDETFPLKEDERMMILTANSKAQGAHPPGAPMQTDGSHASGPVHGFEARKRLRAERKDRLQQWMTHKPGEDADDPRDLVAIAFAQRNMGDYKLKTESNYVVPEDQRVNAAKKRRQMALLEERIYEARLTFNAKVLELRELKLLLVHEMKQDAERLEALGVALQREDHEASLAMDDEKTAAKTTPVDVDLSEWPEQRERASDADIELYLREKKVLSVSTASQQQQHQMASSLTHRRRSSVHQPVKIDGKRVDAVDPSITAVSRRLMHQQSDSGGQDTSSLSTSSSFRVRHMPIDPSAIITSSPQANSSSGRKPTGDSDARAIRIYQIKQEIHRLQRKQRDEIRAFDDAVAHLRREKMRLDVVFKQCELRLFTLWHELSLLEQFESRENLLSSKLDKSKSEKALIVAEIRDIQENMSHKKKDVEEWGKQERAIQTEFLTLVNGANGTTPHPQFLALQKIFKKKIKRAKKKNQGGKDGKDGTGGDGNGGSGGNGEGDPAQDDDDDNDDDEEEEDSDYDDDDDDNDDDDEEDVCPLGCDLQLYEKVLALREKRADVDDALSDLAKALEELKKSNERQVAKQRQIDKELHATEQDIQLFQSEKQTRFNQLDVVVALSKQQIRSLVPKATSQPSNASSRWELPESASNCLVFTSRSFEALSERIESLQRENKSLRQQFKDLHKQQNLLAKEKKVQQETIAQIQHKCEQLQMLKFGQLVDIELLDKACDTTRVSELQAKVRAKEMDTERELSRVKQTQQQLKLRILQATEQNTALLSRIAALNERQFALEKELNQANVGQSVLNDDAELLEQELRERNKLVKIVKLQAREVEALKQEIGLLRGKDGKVYAPM
ncbi:hypothetical protein Poli38472_014318 [Pythium oligandrum]|uniref:EML-like first beta-propeller domain-containing protein n=1 Tax=Pythium oligandrum TaxID=41045 RepID=A0A8K1C771_PYTOL|nr:hypothetical protein Poli38472_014318 [Pythium oligandrum]|eukprot:TMW57715.1 hypothetical protein Poli38472_014318 [Pythium oligandrum]